MAGPKCDHGVPVLESMCTVCETEGELADLRTKLAAAESELEAERTARVEAEQRAESLKLALGETCRPLQVGASDLGLPLGPNVGEGAARVIRDLRAERSELRQQVAEATRLMELAAGEEYSDRERAEQALAAAESERDAARDGLLRQVFDRDQQLSDLAEKLRDAVAERDDLRDANELLKQKHTDES